MTTPAGSPLVAQNGYLALPVTIDPTQLLANELDTLATTFPGWTAHEGNLDVAILEAVSRLVGQLANVANQVPPAIFAYIGGLGGVPPLLGAAATCLSTWTMVDTTGYTVPAGTHVGFQLSDGSLVVFTTAGFTVAAGSQTATGVTLTAVALAAAGNGLAAQTLVQVDSLAFVQSVASTSVTAGGVDPETQTAYLNRLSTEMQLLAPRPITPADFAAYSQNTTGVYRALSVDGLIPQTVLTDGVTTASNTTVSSASASFGPAQQGQPISGGSIPAGTTVQSVTDATHLVLTNAPTASATGVTFTLARETGQERAVSVCPVDSSGNAVTSSIATALQTALAAKREVNFAVSIITPTYTTVNVTWQAHATTGANANAVTAAVNAALTAFLSPGTWAQPAGSPQWTPGVTTVRYLDLVAVVHGVSGVAYVESLTFGTGGTYSTSDLVMSGDAPLPKPGSISGSLV